MTLSAYLSAFLALVTLGLAFFCCRCRHLALALPLASLCLCLALALAFEVPKPSPHQLSDSVLLRDKLIFWNGLGNVSRAAAIFSIRWLMLRWKPLPWPTTIQRLLTAGLVLLFLTFAYLCLFRRELLVASVDYDPVSHLTLVQITALRRCWALFGGLIQLTNISWLLLNWIQSPSPPRRQQARWLLLALCVPLILPFFYFLPLPLRGVAFLYLRPWLRASIPFLIAWALFRTGLLAHLPYYQSLVFQRMPTAALVLDNQQRILALNPPAEQLFQLSPDKVEGQTLDQALPMLHHPTAPLLLNHQPYRCSSTPLFDQRNQSTGHLIRLLPLPTPESEQQLLADLGLSVRELKYDSPDGHSYSWNEYLGDLIFQVTMVGSLSITHVEAEIEIVDRKLQAVAQRYPHRQLCAIIDIEQVFNLDRQARGAAINQWIKWGQDPNFGHMAVIQGRGIIKVVLDTLQRLAPELKISIHPNSEEALAYLRQQQRQLLVGQSEFWQWWQPEQETMQVGDQDLKVVRRPEWVCATETGRVEHSVIESETIVVNASGAMEPELVESSFDIVDQIRSQLGAESDFA